MKIKHRLLAFAVTSALSLLGPGSGRAGWQTQAASCSASADGSGYCGGTLLGFRNHADPMAYVYFREDSNGTRTFLGQTSAGATHMCVPAAALTTLWRVALNFRGYFYISWDANGTCTSLTLYNGSAYSSF